MGMLCVCRIMLFSGGILQAPSFLCSRCLLQKILIQGDQHFAQAKRLPAGVTNSLGHEPIIEEAGSCSQGLGLAWPANIERAGDCPGQINSCMLHTPQLSDVQFSLGLHDHAATGQGSVPFAEGKHFNNGELPCPVGVLRSAPVPRWGTSICACRDRPGMAWHDLAAHHMKRIAKRHHD